MSVTTFIRGPYLGLRSRVRSFVLKHPKLDFAIGRMLVRFDQALRNSGVVTATDPTATEFEYRGLKFRFDEGNREIADEVASTGAYEPETLECILGLLSPGGVFVDLGASIGIFTLLAARAVGPSGVVFAFEPTPSTVALLRHNLGLNGLAAQVTVAETAVAKGPGRARFALRKSGPGNAIAVASDIGTDFVDVEVTGLDSYFEQRHWPRIDLIKMDVEGQELATFEGMHQLAARNPAMRLIFEYHGGQLKRTGISGAELIAAAQAAGFDSFEVLFRNGRRLEFPADLPELDRLSNRAVFNILAWRGQV